MALWDEDLQEGVRVDQEELNEFGGSINVTGGLIKFSIKMLTRDDGHNVVRLILDRTSMEGEIAVLRDFAAEEEVVGLISGDTFDRGSNASAELEAISRCLQQVVAENEEVFIVELYSSPEDGMANPMEFIRRLKPFTAAVRQAMEVPDFLPATTGASDDAWEQFLKGQEGDHKDKVVKEDDMIQFLKKYQRGLHDLGIEDFKRKAMENGFTVEQNQSRGLEQDLQFFLTEQDSGLKSVVGASKRALHPEVRRKVNAFADQFYVQLTRVQASFGGTAFSYRSPNLSRPIHETRPGACWILSSDDKTRWHFGFTCPKRNSVESAIKRATSWLKRTLKGGSVAVKKTSMIESADGFVGRAVVEVPLTTFTAGDLVTDYQQYNPPKVMWFAGDPDSGIEGEEVEVV